MKKWSLRRTARAPLDDFPALCRDDESRLIYLDSAATTQKPRAVLSALERAYVCYSANVHRGAHSLGATATEAYEAARGRVGRFLGATADDCVVFTAGCTSSLNLVARAYGDPHLRPGDEVIATHLEHHSNLVPWQALCERRGAVLRLVPLDERGALDLDEYERLLGDRTRIVCVAHVSNALGTENPVRQMADLAHDVGAVLVVDGAQAVARSRVDLQALGADFYAFSGHKLYGPFGVGVLAGRRELFDAMAPVETGGGMVLEVRNAVSTFVEPPGRFEAGTPPIAEAIALSSAMDYLEGLDLDWVRRHDQGLVRLARERLSSLPGVRLIGTADSSLGVVSFVHPEAHAHDVSTFCDHRGVAIRSGHHCAQLVMRHFGVPATVRASFGVYNTEDDVTALVEAVAEAIATLAGQ